MIADKHVTDDIPAYTLGILDRAEADQVAAHLVSCTVCQDALRAFEQTTAQLALVTPEMAPAPHVKSQLMAQVGAQKRAARQAEARLAAARPVQASWWARVVDVFGLRVPVWGAAALLVIAALVVSNLVLWQQVDRLQTAAHPEPQPLLILQGSENAPDATAVLLVSADGSTGTLVAAGLPQLASEQQYQLWLIEDGVRTDGGVFSVEADGRGTLVVTAPQPLAKYAAFGVTVEPFGGSPGPTGMNVLRGKL